MRKTRGNIRESLEWNIVHNMDTNLGMSLLDSESIDVVYADPPYNIGVDKWDIIPDFADFNEKWITSAARVLKPGGHFFIWGSTYNTFIAEIIVWIKNNKNLNLEFRQQFFWCKMFSRPPPNNLYARKAETVIWFTKNGAPYYFNNEIVQKINIGPCLTNISRDTGALSELRQGIHETIKPDMLARQFFSIHSKIGDRILIPFAGSGSECLTAINMERNFIAFEINPEYVKHISEILQILKEGEIPMEKRSSKRLRLKGGKKKSRKRLKK